MDSTSRHRTEVIEFSRPATLPTRFHPAPLLREEGVRADRDAESYAGAMLFSHDVLQTKSTRHAIRRLTWSAISVASAIVR